MARETFKQRYSIDVYRINGQFKWTIVKEVEQGMERWLGEGYAQTEAEAVFRGGQEIARKMFEQGL